MNIYLIIGIALYICGAITLTVLVLAEKDPNTMSRERVFLKSFLWPYFVFTLLLEILADYVSIQIKKNRK